MFADYPDVVDVSGLQSMLGTIGKQTAYELVRKGTITIKRYAHLDSSTKIKSATAIENALNFNGNKKDILDLNSNTSN